MLVIHPRADASIGPYNLPEGGFLFDSYHTGLQIFAVRRTDFAREYDPRDAGRRYSAMSPAFASGVSAISGSMSGAILPPGIL